MREHGQIAATAGKDMNGAGEVHSSGKVKLGSVAGSTPCSDEESRQMVTARLEEARAWEQRRCGLAAKQRRQWWLGEDRW